MWLRDSVKREAIVEGRVRSAAVRVILRLGWGVVFGGGRGGGVRSVRVRASTWASEERAEARAWPRKPAAPVTRMFMFGRWGGCQR